MYHFAPVPPIWVSDFFLYVRVTKQQVRVDLKWIRVDLGTCTVQLTNRGAENINKQ